MKEIMIIGFGSIGRRHTRNALTLGVKPHVITMHPDDSVHAAFYPSVEKMYNNGRIRHAVIASPTGRHLDDLRRIADTGIESVLIEKPIEKSSKRADAILKLAERKGLDVYIAYNMRYLSAFERIKTFVRRNLPNIRLVYASAGQYLPDWRPARHYTESYSARRRAGGGVDLDLSHEVDYILWIFGNAFKHRLMHRAKISGLKMDGPDIFKLILDYGTFVVDVSLDCIRREKERYLKILCENGSMLHYDFINNKLTVNDWSKRTSDNMNDSYVKMLRAFLASNSKERHKLCTADEGLGVLRVLGV